MKTAPRVTIPVMRHRKKCTLVANVVCGQKGYHRIGLINGRLVFFDCDPSKLSRQVDWQDMGGKSCRCYNVLQQWRNFSISNLPPFIKNEVLANRVKRRYRYVNRIPFIFQPGMSKIVYLRRLICRLLKKTCHIVKFCDNYPHVFLGAKCHVADYTSNLEIFIDYRWFKTVCETGMAIAGDKLVIKVVGRTRSKSKELTYLVRILDDSLNIYKRQQYALHWAVIKKVNDKWTIEKSGPTRADMR